MRERRLAGIRVSPELIYSMLHGWRRKRAIHLPKLDWPLDAEFMSANWSVQHQSFLLVFYHESFPIAFEGEEVEIHCPEMERVIIPREDSK